MSETATPYRSRRIRQSAYECPRCRSKMGVINSRPSPNGVVRRRSCTDCGHRITTHEMVLGHEDNFLEILQAVSAEHDIVGGKIAVLLETARRLRELDEARLGGAAPIEPARPQTDRATI